MTRRFPVFVRRDSYRTRRWRDAARLLPLFGIVLWLLPLLWLPETTQNSAVLVYVFAVWLGLVLAARIIAPGTRAGQIGEDEAAEEGDPGSDPRRDPGPNPPPDTGSAAMAPKADRR